MKTNYKYLLLAVNSMKNMFIRLNQFWLIDPLKDQLSAPPSNQVPTSKLQHVPVENYRPHTFHLPIFMDYMSYCRERP